MRKPSAAVLAVWLLLAPPAHATDPADLCTGNPCVVTTSTRIDEGTLDFGAVDLVITTGTTLWIGQPQEYANVTIIAASITLQSGARIEGRGGYIAYLGHGWSRSVTLQATAGSIELQENSRLDFRGGFSNDVILDATGDVLLDGAILQTTRTRYAYAKNIAITAGGMVRTTKALRADATRGAGGDVTITAPGDVQVAGRLTALGGGLGGAVLITSTAGSVTLDGEVSVSARTIDSAPAGYIIVDAAGDVVVAGRVVLHGDYPGELDVTAGDEVRLVDGATIELIGDKTCSSDGSSLAAGTALLQEAGARIRGCPSALSLTAGTDLTLGEVELWNPRFPGAAGTLTASAGGTLRVTDAIVARHVSGLPGAAVSLTACDIVVEDPATIDARTSTLRGADSLLVAGDLTATEQNLLEYNAAAPVITGAVTPAPVIVSNPGLTCGP